MGIKEEVERAKDTYHRLMSSKERQERIHREQKDEEERSNPLGLFNFAESYWIAARTLNETERAGTHKEDPVRFLYYHALEMYLKAFLRAHGVTVKELASRQFGHRYCCLLEKATCLGLSLTDEDVDVFSRLMNSDAVIRARYLQTGFFRWPTIEALERTCKSLREPISARLKKAGIPVRV